MADVELVIKIPEEEYQNYFKMNPAYPEGVFCYIKAIQHGTLLPKKHGKLIDADALDASIVQAGFAYALTRRKLRYTAGDIRQKIANAPTIIEADKE